MVKKTTSLAPAKLQPPYNTYSDVITRDGAFLMTPCIVSVTMTARGKWYIDDQYGKCLMLVTHDYPPMNLMQNIAYSDATIRQIFETYMRAEITNDVVRKGTDQCCFLEKQSWFERLMGRLKEEYSIMISGKTVPRVNL